MLPESGTLMTLPKRNWMDMTWQDVAGAGADTARWFMLSDSPPERDLV